MRYSTYARTRDEILDHLENTYHTTVRVGWGVTDARPSSITNTAEALLVFDVFGALQHPFLDGHRAEIVAFLTSELSDERLPHLRVREAAFGALALRLLHGERTETEDRAIDALKGMGARDGGWGDRAPTDSRPWFIPTYQALTTLRRLGYAVEPAHLEWIRQLQRPDGRFRPAPGAEASDTITLLALEVFADDAREFVRIIPAARDVLRRQLHAMGEGHPVGEVLPLENWTVYGYGRALRVFAESGEEMLQFPLHTLFGQYEMPPAARLQVPEVLEFAIAVTALRDHLNYQQLFSRTTADSELDAQRAALVDEERALATRQAVLDAMERDLDRERAALRDVETSILEVVDGDERATPAATLSVRLLVLLLITVALMPLCLSLASRREGAIVWAVAVAVAVFTATRWRRPQRSKRASGRPFPEG